MCRACRFDLAWADPGRGVIGRYAQAVRPEPSTPGLLDTGDRHRDRDGYLFLAGRPPTSSPGGEKDQPRRSKTSC